MVNSGLIESLSARNEQVDNSTCQPLFFNIQRDDDQIRLNELIQTHPNLNITDEIDSQLQELIKLRYPKKKFNEQGLQMAIEGHLKGSSSKEYGNWIYYPWLSKLVHVLPENEFVEVRTNRNQYKITPEEEALLANKKIGIIGLSVGKAIALTIALERICGELVLADFDLIELSNLNRIQTGVHNFGLKKTVVVAREIAEIDPYLTVTCYDEGLTEDNVNDFFTKDKQLDICIEVCDGLHTKIYARQKAKELGIPVVMNSSDRGTTDIERFDLEPDLPILHGLIDHLDLSKVKLARTNEEKVPYLLPMLGVESSSDRLKASMLEIQESITTWPQLASGVVFGGGVCTDVCRRMLLGQFTKSGRYFVDTEQEINDEVVDYISFSKSVHEQIDVIPNTCYSDYEVAVEKLLSTTEVGDEVIDVARTKLEDMLNAACMAPSGGNIQPWKWIYKDKVLLLFIDKNRTNSILNYNNLAANIALGAALQNLELKANAMGFDALISKFPDSNNQDLIAGISFENSQSDKGLATDLVNHIPSRMTNRMVKATGDLSAQELNFFSSFKADQDQLEIKLFTARSKMDEIKDIMMQVDKLYYTSRVGHESFVRELRWSQKETRKTKDGVDIETIDLSPTEKAGFLVSKDWKVVQYLNDWNLGAAYSKLTQKGIDGASALVVITGPETIDPSNYVDAGILLQRLWLEATRLELAFQPMSISTFLFARSKYEEQNKLASIAQSLSRLEQKFNVAAGIEEGQRPVFIFRLAKADEHKIRSLRRNLSEVFIYEK